MAKEKKEGKPKEVVPAHAKLQKFLEEENIVIAPQPQFKPRDDGTFSVVVGFSAEYGGQRPTD